MANRTLPRRGDHPPGPGERGPRLGDFPESLPGPYSGAPRRGTIEGVSIIIRIIVNALALAAAAYLIDGIEIAPTGSTSEQILTYSVIAIVFGVVNAVIKPIVKTVGCAFYILTLGLVALVVNALLLMLTAWAAGVLGFHFTIADFWPSAVLGALVISIVSWLLSFLVPDSED